MKILVIRGGALGDFLVTLPTLRLLRERWPDSRINLLGHPHLAEPARNRFYLDSVRSVNHGPLSSFFMPRAVLDPEWMEYVGGHDLVLSYFYDPDQLFETNLNRCRPGRVLVHSPQVPKHWREPAARYFAEMVRPLDLALGDDAATDLFPSPDDLAAARAFLSGLPCRTPIVAIHPSSGSESKTWPVDRWRQLGRTLAKQFPALTLLLIEGEADAEPAQFLAEDWRDLNVVRARLLPLPVLTAVLRSAALFIGHDSGITHLAGASRRDLPVITLFGPTNPEVWAPPRAHIQVLRESATRVSVTVEQVEAAALACLRTALTAQH